MKHFLPSSVMLTPFVVKYYSEEDDASESQETCQGESAPQNQIEEELEVV